MNDRREAVQRGSENVFADVDVQDPADAQAKADIALALGRIIEDRGLTPTAAAALLGVTELDVSDILRGRLGGFSLERLVSLIARIR